MNSTFSTKDFNTLFDFIKSLLKENYQVRISVDCENVYMVDYCSSYESESFELFDEENSL